MGSHGAAIGLGVSGAGSGFRVGWGTAGKVLLLFFGASIGEVLILVVVVVVGGGGTGLSFYGVWTLPNIS